jgi:TrmH family RNA methyltransferase
VHALISANPCTDIFHPNAIRASLGTLLAMPVAEADSAAVLNWLLENGFSIYAAWVGAEHSYHQINYPMRTAIVLGNEAEGLSDVWRGAAVTPIGLPMRGIADSLNISAAAAVLMYEVATQSPPQRP